MKTHYLPKGRVPAQQGQALAETLVVASFVLVPFVIAVPLLAKYQSIRQANVSAARTAAFECSVRYQDCEQQASTDAIADQIRRRHFSTSALSVRSDEAVTDDQVETQYNRLWVDRQGKPLLDSYRNVALTITREKFDAVNPKRKTDSDVPLEGDSVKARQVLSRLINGASQLAGPGRFGMDIQGGLFTAQIQTSLPLDPWWNGILPVDHDASNPLRFTEKLVVLGDAWNASSAKGKEDTSFQSRVQRGRRLPDLNDVVFAASTVLGKVPPEALNRVPRINTEGFFEMIHAGPSMMVRHVGRLELFRKPGKDFRYHDLDVDIVPEDRLEGGPQPPRKKTEARRGDGRRN